MYKLLLTAVLNATKHIFSMKFTFLLEIEIDTKHKIFTMLKHSTFSKQIRGTLLKTIAQIYVPVLYTV